MGVFLWGDLRLQLLKSGRLSADQDVKQNSTSALVATLTMERQRLSRLSLENGPSGTLRKSEGGSPSS